MDKAWERAVEAALHTAGEGSSSPARRLTLDGAVKCMHGRLPAAEILERHQSLEHLSIAGVGVASLAGFPRLRNLTRLTLSDNRIAGGLEHLVEAGLGSLRDLDLSNNRIQDVDDLAPLARLRLVSLDLYECPVTRVKDYRSRVFGMIRILKYLDKMDADEVVSDGGVEHHHRANGFQVAEVGVAPDEDDEDVEDDDDDKDEEHEEEGELGEEIDEEGDEDDAVVEVHDVPSSDGEEDGIDEDDDEEEEVEDDGKEAEPESSGRFAMAVGGVGEEIDGHEQGEGDDEDENGEIGEEDEERLEDSRVYEEGNDDDADDERRGFGRVRIGLMAVAVSAEEVLQHMRPVPRVEESNNVAAGEELGGDYDEILRFMDSTDGYLLLMDSLSSALRQGWIDLASARHSMGASRVSSTLFDHKEQSAATNLQVVYPADLQPSESNPHFYISKWCLQKESDSSDVVSVQDSTKSKLRYRGSAATSDSSNESDATTGKSSTGVDVSSQVRRARSKAISVFGALLSPKLRTAQVSFETALELIVELANSRSTILSSFSQIKREA